MSEYHYIHWDIDRIYHTKGKSYPSEMFSGLFILIDHDSGYMIIRHQVAINATDTVKVKLTFYKEAQSQGVVIKSYHTYNGIFDTSEFMKELLKRQKKIRFSGSGASHINGAA